MKVLNFKYKSILALSTCLLLLSCGQKAKTNVKASVSILGNLISGISLPGGIMFFGKNHDTGEIISRKLDNNTELILNNGRWDFAAIGWDTSAFEGTQRCAINLGIQLRGGDAEVNFNLNTTTCNNALFAPSSTRDAAGAMKPLEIKNCSHANGLYGDWDPDSCKRGIFQGYTVAFPEVMPGGGFNMGPNSIKSACKAHTPNNAADLFASVKLPIINFPGGPAITTIISGYDNSTCDSGYKEDFIFEKKPLMAGINFRAQFNERDNSKNTLTLVSNNCAPGSIPYQATVSYAQSEIITATSESQNIICTDVQFDRMMSTVGDSAKTFILGTDITLDAPYTNSAFNNTSFTGKLLGFGHAITNLNLNLAQGSNRGLFSSVQTAKIKNVIFNNAQMTVAVGPSNANSGLLVGSIGSSTEIRDVSFNAPQLTINCSTACSGFGIVAGSASASSQATAAQISETEINNPIINLGTNAGEAGGLIGKVENNIYIRNNKLSNVSIRSFSGQTIGVNIGGAIGLIAPTSASYSSEVWGLDVNVNIDNTANQIIFPASANVGGAIGKIGNGTLHEARLNNIKVSGNIRNPQTGNFYIGGFAGYVSSHQNIENIITNVVIDTPGASYVGGIVGKHYTTSTASPIRNIRSFGAINCDNICGGAFGSLGGTASLNLENSFSRSSIISSGDDLGGLIGAFATSAASTIQRSFATGNITGDNVLSVNVGGLIGSISGGVAHNITDSFADGAVQGVPASTGLLIGSLPASTSSFSNLLGLGTGSTELIGQCFGSCIPSSTVAPRIPIMGAYAHNFPFPKTLNSSSGSWNSSTNNPTLANGASCSIGSYYVSNGIGSAVINGDMSGWASNDIIFCTSSGYYKMNNPIMGTHGLHGTIATGSLNDITSYGGINGNVNWYAGANHPLLKWAYPLSVLGEQTLGTREDPFLLNSYWQWNAIGDNPNLMTANFKLIGDLDFSGQSFIPVGSDSDPFKGSLLGNNKTIKNINYANSSGPIGIFRKLGVGAFGPSAQIEHWDEDTNESYKLYLQNINFTQSSTSSAGILAGTVEDGANDQFKAIRISNVEILNSTINGNASSGNIGGLIGDLNYQNSNTQISSIISDVTINNCPTIGKVGGVIGHINQISAPTLMLTLRNWKSTSDIFCLGSGDSVGGVIGRADGSTKLSLDGMLFEGSIQSASNVGGIIGTYNAYSLSVGYSKGSVIGSGQNVGGAIGSAIDGYITGVYTTATINGAANVGGFIGQTSGSSRIDNCYASNAQATSNFFVGNNIGNTCGPSQCNNYHVNGSANQILTNLVSFPITSVAISVPSTHLDSGNPWFFDGAGLPKIIPEVFPEYFDQ